MDCTWEYAFKELQDSVLSWSFQDVLQSFQHQNPFIPSFMICFVVSLLTWIGGPLMNNYSHVDRLWSVLPPFYAGIFALQDLKLLVSGQPQSADARVLLCFFVAVVWGARLSYNFYRKGGYSAHGEDYRWPEIRKVLPPFAFQILNFVFIAFVQNYLLWAIAAPAYIAQCSRGAPLNQWDLVAAVGYLTLVLGETVADQQQWNFQSAKYAKLARKETLTGDYKRGFLTRGLFKFSRHPNFFCEITLWWFYYLFSVAATGQWLNWTIAGPISLLLLFQGSTTFTEILTKRKYPEYALYQKSTSRLIPWIPAKAKCE